LQPGFAVIAFDIEPKHLTRQSKVADQGGIFLPHQIL